MEAEARPIGRSLSVVPCGLAGGSACARGHAVTDTGNARSAASDAMDRYASGDNAAFAQLYDALAPRLLGYLCRLTGDRRAAEDLLQQTFLQMHEARARFARGADVTPWAMAIARRLFLDGFRRAKARRTDLTDATTLESSAADPAPSPEAWASARETQVAVDAALAEMVPQQREAFRLVKEEGLSIAEAAAVLGTTRAAVKLRAHRAYDRLRTILATPGKSR